MTCRLCHRVLWKYGLYSCGFDKDVCVECAVRAVGLLEQRVAAAQTENEASEKKEATKAELYPCPFCGGKADSISGTPRTRDAMGADNGRRR